MIEEKYSKDDFLKGMQTSQLEILKSLKKVCDEHNVVFYLAFGTALGAVRHKGFIPWDDDIDIYMRMEDIEKLKEIQKFLPSNLFVQTRDKEKEYGLLIARVRDSNTTLVEEDHMNRDINHGVYIDVYPLFYCPESNMKMKWIVGLSFLCRLFAYNAPPANKGGIATKVSKFLLNIFPNKVKRKIADKLYTYITSQPVSKYVSTFPDVSLGKRFKDEWFKVPSTCIFEGEEMPMPTKQEDYLTYEFGDYMQLPPVEKRQIHHHYIFADFENSYQNYKGVKYCAKKD